MHEHVHEQAADCVIVAGWPGFATIQKTENVRLCAMVHLWSEPFSSHHPSVYFHHFILPVCALFPLLFCNREIIKSIHCEPKIITLSSLFFAFLSQGKHADVALPISHALSITRSFLSIPFLMFCHIYWPPSPAGIASLWWLRIRISKCHSGDSSVRADGSLCSHSRLHVAASLI